MIEVKRAQAQARDPGTDKPTRAIRDAPEPMQLALEDARRRKRDAEATLRDESPGGCRPNGGALLTALPAAAVDFTGAGGRLSALAVASTLRDAIDAHAEHAGRLSNEVGSLLPYLRALRAAGEAGADVTSLDHATVQQSGFDLLNEVMAGKAPTCCICVQPAVHPCIARCMHLACTRCMVTWYHAAPLHGNNNSGAPPCPLCRKPFTIDELIRLIPPAKEDDETAEEKTAPADTKRRGEARKGKEKPGGIDQDAKEEQGGRRTARWSGSPAPPRPPSLPGCRYLPARTLVIIETGGTLRCPWTEAVSWRTCTARRCDARPRWRRSLRTSSTRSTPPARRARRSCSVN